MTSSPATMRAVRLSAPGPVGNLRLTTLPLPPERDGWVRIRVEAFGLNRVYDGLEQVPQAHDDMEHDRATGKPVVRVRH
jgi:hypothetical protein